MNEVDIIKLVIAKSDPFKHVEITKDSCIQMQLGGGQIATTPLAISHMSSAQPTQPAKPNQSKSPDPKKAKKSALIHLCKLWSAFSKSLRQFIEIKKQPVRVKNLGTFYPGSLYRPGDDVVYFLPILDFVNILRASNQMHPDQSQAVDLLKCNNGLNMAKIKKAAELPIHSVPEELLSQIFQMAAHQASVCGTEVRLTLKVGTLIMKHGEIRLKTLNENTSMGSLKHFSSMQELEGKSPDQQRNNNAGHSFTSPQRRNSIVNMQTRKLEHSPDDQVQTLPDLHEQLTQRDNSQSAQGHFTQPRQSFQLTNVDLNSTASKNNDTFEMRRKTIDHLLTPSENRSIFRTNSSIGAPQMKPNASLRPDLSSTIMQFSNGGQQVASNSNNLPSPLHPFRKQPRVNSVLMQTFNYPQISPTRGYCPKLKIARVSVAEQAFQRAQQRNISEQIEQQKIIKQLEVMRLKGVEQQEKDKQAKRERNLGVKLYNLSNSYKPDTDRDKIRMQRQQTSIMSETQMIELYEKQSLIRRRASIDVQTVQQTQMDHQRQTQSNNLMGEKMSQIGANHLVQLQHQQEIADAKLKRRQTQSELRRNWDKQVDECKSRLPLI